MRKLFATFALLTLAVAANGGSGGGAIGTKEYRDYNAYKNKFRIPTDAKNVQLQGVQVKKVDIGREESWYPGCSETVDGGPNECVVYNLKSEKALQTRILFQSNESYPRLVDSDDYNQVVANVPLNSVAPDKVAGIPKKSKANKEYAQGLFELKVTDEMTVEGRIDEKESKLCPRDGGEGDKLDPSCEDRIVYKNVQIPARYVEVVVKP